MGLNFRLEIEYIQISSIDYLVSPGWPLNPLEVSLPQEKERIINIDSFDIPESYSGILERGLKARNQAVLDIMS